MNENLYIKFLPYQKKFRIHIYVFKICSQIIKIHLYTNTVLGGSARLCICLSVRPL